MNKVAIAFSTKDRCELSRRTVEPLLQPDKFDLFWIDGSNTDEGMVLPHQYDKQVYSIRNNVRGGADAAIVYGLTELLTHPLRDYDYVGLVENDVLPHPDWFAPTMALFDRGCADGLEVGAVSARCYEDRILCQRDGYALLHNIGAGMVIFSRRAAELVLRHFRTGWTTDNRRTFMILSGLDIGRWAFFRTSEHPLCADWGFDCTLAAHGLASLALTPSPVEMIGQDPPLEQQGLRIVTEPVELLRNDEAFERFATRTARIRDGLLRMPDSVLFQAPDGSQMVFPHQVGLLGGRYVGDWRLKWSQGMGPFTWEAASDIAALSVPVFGPCGLMVSGGREGGKIEVVDTESGYEIAPTVEPEGPNGQVLNLVVPGQMTYRTIELRASAGTRFYGLTVRDPQPTRPDWTFDHSILPPTG